MKYTCGHQHYVPETKDIDVQGLDITQEQLDELLTINKKVWLEDVESSGTGIEAYFAQFGDRLPAEMQQELDTLKNNLTK